MDAFRLITRTILPAACLVGAAYNACLMVNGPEGQVARERLERRLAAERVELARSRDRVAMLGERADGLMMASLDPDLLEEALRERLGLVREGERLVRMSDLDRLAAAEPTGLAR
jgi:cell division protein FtsB